MNMAYTVRKTMLEMDTIISFGKYKGSRVLDLLDTDYRYLQWLQSNGKKHIFSDEVKEELYARIESEIDTNIEHPDLWQTEEGDF